MIRLAGFVLVVLVLAYVGWVKLLYVMQRDIIYNPVLEVPDQARFDAMDATVFTTRTDDELMLTHWLFRPAAPNRPWIVLFHGNGGHIGHRVAKARDLAANGYGVVLASYRGYGANPGSPSESGLILDARSVMAYLVSDPAGPQIPLNRLALYGESLGAAVAVQMAALYPDSCALVLEVPFYSVPELAREFYPLLPAPDWIVQDSFRSDLVVPTLPQPKLFMIAGQDEIVPTQHGVRLFEAAAEPKQKKIFERATHNTLFDHGAASFALDFIRVCDSVPRLALWKSP